MTKNISFLTKRATFILIFLSSISICSNSFAYTSTSWTQNCWWVGINDIDQSKNISQTIDFTAPTSGSLSCSSWYYTSWNWYPATWTMTKLTNFSCPSSSYASKIDCYPAATQNWATDCTAAFTSFRVYCKIKDTTPPWSPTTWIFRFLANVNQNLSFSYPPDGGAPISSVAYDIESDANRTVFVPHTGTTFPFSFTANLSHVDTQTDWGDIVWSRRFTVRAKKVCDLGGNCNCISWSPDAACDLYTLPTYTLNVYANSPASSAYSTADVSEATVAQPADASIHSIDLSLRDLYGNKIVPVGEISRVVDMRFDVTNTHYLNQYTLSWESGVLFNIPANPTNSNYLDVFTLGWRANKDFSSVYSTTWDYSFKYKAFSPTSLWYSYASPNSNFTIHSIKYSVNDTVAWNTGFLNFSTASAANFNLQPLYTSVISGDIKNYWLSIGSQQNSTITVSKNPSSTATSTANSILIEFWKGARIIQNALNMVYSKTWVPTNPVVEWHQTNLTSLTAFSSALPIASTGFLTKINQESWIPVDPADINYLSTHINYTIGGKTVSYNGDIIGRTNYWLNTWNSSNFSWIKVSGVTTSTNTWEVVTNQLWNDITVLWSLNKASLKKDIISKVFWAISQVTPANGTDNNYQITDLSNFNSNADWVKLQEGDIIYFWWLNGETVFLWDILWANVWERVTWKKTIIISWWNLYIKSNMYYNSKTADILGIVVLNSPNDSSKGWNVYIDSEVTNVVWNIFAEKSIITAKLNTSTTPNSVIELDWGSTFDELKNQLHIYWSVYSENTIGWSRAATLKCPYYVSSTDCSNMEEAQKFDLNFLRRFYIDPTWAPAKWGKVIWWWTCIGTACTWWNTSFSRNITATTDKYGKYPIVIEYQPLFATTPPPLFSK